MTSIFVNCPNPDFSLVIAEKLGGKEKPANIISCSDLKEALGIVMDGSIDLLMVCAEELSRTERNLLGYLSFTYPDLKIMVNLGKPENKEIFLNKGMMQSDPVVLKEITESCSKKSDICNLPL